MRFGFHEIRCADVLRKDGHSVGVLGLGHYKDTVQATQATHGTQFVLHELLVRVHVAGVHFYHEIVVTAGVETFGDLVNVLDSVNELLYHLLGVLFKADVA